MTADQIAQAHHVETPHMSAETFAYYGGKSAAYPLT
tara:strand:- start:416 stop:523 length:108 start_codon:yes stop_codon:yes gene_type:complete